MNQIKRYILSILLLGLKPADRNNLVQSKNGIGTAFSKSGNKNYARFFLPYISIIIFIEYILLHYMKNQAMLLVLNVLIMLLVIRQIFIWSENKELLSTFQDLHEKLEDRVNEGIRALAKSEQQYKSLFESHPDAVFSLDLSGNFQSVNISCTHILGYDQEELFRQSFLNFIIEDDQKLARDAFRNAKTGIPQTFEVRGIRKQLELYYLHITLIPIMIGKQPVGMYGIAKDMTELKRNQEKIERLAFHDVLTGLPNRRKFEDSLQNALKKANERNNMVAVFYIDLDRFKKINDRLGHDAGDLLLIEVAKRLTGCLRTKDLIARQGGDEFTLFLQDVFSPQNATLVAERLLETLNQPFSIDGHDLKITPSIGIALYPTHGTNVTKLMKNADRAMYQAKTTGKNKYVIYSKEMSEKEEQKLLLEEELTKALERNEFVLHYQPQIDIQTNKIIGFEALLRWQHPKLGMVSPAEFIPLLEETGQIIQIGEWVLRTACQQAKEWHKQGFPYLKVAVNLSPVQFDYVHFIEMVSNILHETKLSPHCLDLEITEGIAMKKEEQVIRKLEKLQALGVQISIDDFGTGYSSLSYLTKYPINTLKIAREFIQEIENDKQQEAIISSIIMMAKNLKLTVIAEGVETKAQAAFLQKKQCDQIQGFYFSKPLEADQICKLLHRQTVKVG